jgi:hypothetical protein
MIKTKAVPFSKYQTKKKQTLLYQNDKNNYNKSKTEIKEKMKNKSKNLNKQDKIIMMSKI